MKKIILGSMLLVSLIYADGNHIEIGAGYQRLKDSFSTESDSKIANYSQAKEESSAIPYINLLLNYKINKNLTAYLDTSRALTTGLKAKTNYGSFDFGISYEMMQEEYQNPYLLNQNRADTDVDEFGFYLGYGFSLIDDLNHNIVFKYSNRDYDRDEVAMELKRGGDRNILALESSYRGFLFNLEVESYEADGDSSTYDAYGASFGYQSQFFDKFSAMALVSFSTKEYDKSHPVFNKVVDSDTFGAFVQLNCDDPFDLNDDVYVSLKGSYSQENANVDFYDKESLASILSVGYKF